MVDEFEPKPLREVNPKAEVHSFGQALSLRPDLAVVYANAISCSSLTEAALLELLLAALKGSIDPALAMLDTLGPLAHVDAAEAAIGACLSEDEANVFRPVMRYYRDARKLRNRLAHWFLGIDINMTDVLIAVEPAAWLKWSKQTHEKRQQNAFAVNFHAGPPPLARPFPAAELGDKALVYGTWEISDVTHRMTTTADLFTSFREMVGLPAGSPERAARLSRVAQVPGIAARLASRQQQAGQKAKADRRKGPRAPAEAP